MSGRIRTIKPEWLEDELLAALPDSDRTLSVGLILMADDHGRGRAADAFVAGEVWRYDRSPEVLKKAREGLLRLSEIRFIRLYVRDGQRYFEIRNWKIHQKVQHVGRPRVPPPLEPHEILTNPHEVLTNPPEVLTPDLRPHITDHDHDLIERGAASDPEPPEAPPPATSDAPAEAVAAPKVPKPGPLSQKAAKATRCPTSVDPTAVAWCASRGIPPPTGEVARMLDYFASAPGARGAKVDWAATWRNWSRRASEFAPRAAPGSRNGHLQAYVPDPENPYHDF
jgi:hypothetical protein